MCLSCERKVRNLEVVRITSHIKHHIAGVEIQQVTAQLAQFLLCLRRLWIAGCELLRVNDLSILINSKWNRCISQSRKPKKCRLHSDHLTIIPVYGDFVKESRFERRLCDVGGCLQVIFLSVQLINQMKEIIPKDHANVVSWGLWDNWVSTYKRALNDVRFWSAPQRNPLTHVFTAHVEDEQIASGALATASAVGGSVGSLERQSKSGVRSQVIYVCGRAQLHMSIPTEPHGHNDLNT